MEMPYQEMDVPYRLCQEIDVKQYIIREVELRKEHLHRKEASARRKEEMKHQMELLTRLVEGVYK